MTRAGLTSQQGQRINGIDNINETTPSCDALGSMGVVGSILHADFQSNPWHKTTTKTPQAAVVQATKRPERGGQAGQKCAFAIKDDTDLLYGATLIGILPGLYAKVDAGASSQTPVIDDLYFPLRMEDATAISSAAGTTKGYLASYYGANADTVLTNATTACQTPSALEYVAYSVEAGLYLFTRSTIKAGSCKLDEHVAQYIAAENALNGTIDQDMTEMWGGAASLADSVLKSMFSRFVYVILPFFFSRNIGATLSLVSCIFSSPEICSDVAKLSEITFRSETNVAVMHAPTEEKLNNSHSMVGLDCRYILLENMLRDAFASADFENVILVTDVDVTTKSKALSKSRVEMHTQGYALAHLILVQRCAAQEKNMWSYYAGIDGRDALVNINVNVNSSCLMNVEAVRARTVGPAFATPRIPTIPVYIFSYTVNIFSDHILMGRNLTLVNNVSLELAWQAGLETEECTVYVFTVKATLLKYRQQHASLMFK
jgi:hypothetical protein